MQAPVDLTNLQSIIGNDADLRHKYFQLFIELSVQNLETLRASVENDTCSLWRRQAHALKGTSLNLGAERLSQLCLKAQQSFQADPKTKLELLAEIQAEFERVKQYLNEINRRLSSGS